MLRYSVPPGDRRKKPPARPKLDPFVGIIDRILEEDGQRPNKQRHTPKWIFERLRDEHGFTGGITIVKDYVFAARQRQREMYVPLCHEPGHARVDFGEALAVIAGVERRIHFLAMDVPQSDACFVKALCGVFLVIRPLSWNPTTVQSGGLADQGCSVWDCRPPRQYRFRCRWADGTATSVASWCCRSAATARSGSAPG